MKMKKVKFLAPVIVTVVMFINIGCSKSTLLNPAGNCSGENWAQSYTDELQTWSAAITAYGENPTPENCATYKAAAKGYLNALNDVYDCVPTGSRAEFEKAINEAKAEVDRDGCD